MIKIALSVLLALSVASSNETSLKSGNCEVAQEGGITVSFKAYKTPAKIGVGGIFDSVVYTPAVKVAKDASALLVGSSVSIDTASVNSKDKGRDAKLVASFFQVMSTQKITAKILEAKAGQFIVEVTMNGVTKNVPMSFVVEDKKVVASGTIDLFDFSANKELASINQACFEKHAGKTWSDVTIGFTTNLTYPSCK